jgi:hypothetical protein
MTVMYAPFCHILFTQAQATSRALHIVGTPLIAKRKSMKTMVCPALIEKATLYAPMSGIERARAGMAAKLNSVEISEFRVYRSEKIAQMSSIGRYTVMNAKGVSHLSMFDAMSRRSSSNPLANALVSVPGNAMRMTANSAASASTEHEANATSERHAFESPVFSLRLTSSGRTEFSIALPALPEKRAMIPDARWYESMPADVPKAHATNSVLA